MQRILTITLNPSIDKSISVAGLYPDRKLHCGVHDFQPGGGGINVSRALKNLGGLSECWFLEGGFHGAFLAQLIGDGIVSRSFPIAGETRENLIVRDTSTGAQYLFDTEGPLVSEPECGKILAALNDLTCTDMIVASGSLPPGVASDFYARLAKIVKSKGMRLVLDTSGEALALALKEGLYLFKPNLREFCTLSGAVPENLADVQLKAMTMARSGSCEVAVISLGAGGALLATRDYSEHIPAPTINSRGTVGAGDSMVAGIVYQLSKGADLRKAVGYGIASGAAATMAEGTSLCSIQDTERLFTSMQQRSVYK